MYWKFQTSLPASLLGGWGYKWVSRACFSLGPMFILSISQTQLLRMCLFPCEAYDSRKGGQTRHPKKKWKEKTWAQTNNALPNNHVRHNEASFNSTKWRCPYDNVTYCKFTPNRKQLPKQLPPHFTWHAPEWTCIGSDGSMTVNMVMKNPCTNENWNLSNIFHNNIHRKKVESLKVRSTEEFLCQFAWLPCRFFRGRRQGRQPLNMYKYVVNCILVNIKKKYIYNII